MWGRCVLVIEERSRFDEVDRTGQDGAGLGRTESAESETCSVFKFEFTRARAGDKRNPGTTIPSFQLTQPRIPTSYQGSDDRTTLVSKCGVNSNPAEISLKLPTSRVGIYGIYNTCSCILILLRCMRNKPGAAGKCSWSVQLVSAALFDHELNLRCRSLKAGRGTVDGDTLQIGRIY